MYNNMALIDDFLDNMERNRNEDVQMWIEFLHRYLLNKYDQ